MSNGAKTERQKVQIKSNGRLVLLQSQDDHGPVEDVTATAHQHLFDECTCEEPMLVNDLFRFFAKRKKMMSVFMATRPVGSYIDIWQRCENKHPNLPGTYVLPNEFKENGEALINHVARVHRSPKVGVSFDCYHTLGGMGYALEFMPFAVARSLQFVIRGPVTLAELIDSVFFELAFLGEPDNGYCIAQRLNREPMEVVLGNPFREERTKSKAKAKTKTNTPPRPTPPQVKKEWSSSSSHLCPGGLLFRFWNSIETDDDGGGWVDVSKHSFNFLLGRCQVEQGVTYGDLFLLMERCEDSYTDIFARADVAKLFTHWRKQLRVLPWLNPFLREIPHEDAGKWLGQVIAEALQDRELPQFSLKMLTRIP